MSNANHISIKITFKQGSEKIIICIEEKMKGSEGEDQPFNKSEMEEDFKPVVEDKLRYNLSKSVGYLSWNKGNNRGSATCFVFNDLFIFTCWHVIRDIVEGERDRTKWAEIVSKCVTVSFGYEEETEKEKGSFSLAPWLEVFDESLDYAVLKLEPAEGVQVPSGLYSGCTTEEYGRKLYIIGHPEGKIKSMGHVFMTQENVGTSFYPWASGSPLFDSDSNYLLVAMSVSLKKILEGTNKYLISFGPSMHCILNHIEQNFPNWYQQIVNRPDEEMSSQDD